MKKTFLTLGGIAVVVLLVVLFADSNSQYKQIYGGQPSFAHKLQVTAPSAYEAIPGERVTEAGLTAGYILSTNITHSGKAHLVLGIANGNWPVPSDSVLHLREGGTIKATDRYISITPGHARTDFANDASVPVSQFIVPVEYDELFNVFTPKTRAGLQKFFNLGGADLGAAGPDIHSAIGDAAPAIGQVSDVFNDIDYDQQALTTLLKSTATVADAVQASNPGVQDLLTGAASMFTDIASQSTQLKSAISEIGPDLPGPSALFVHAANTLTNLRGLTNRLHTGLAAVDKDAQPLNNTLAELVSVEPKAVSTLDTVKTKGPTIDSFLTDARTTLLPKVTNTSTQLGTILDCVRPFTPDIMDLLQNWGSFLGSNGLNTPKIALAHFLVSFAPILVNDTLTPVQVAKTFPDYQERYPQAPGTAFNQPWYQPQCGITANNANAADDSDGGTYDPRGTKLVPYQSTTPNYNTTTTASSAQ